MSSVLRRESVSTILLTIVLARCVHSHQGHGGGVSQTAPHAHNLMDSRAIEDPEHMKQHLEGRIKSGEKLSPDELHFHYFKVHDYDDNNMLDGVEIVSALTHHESDPNSVTEEKPVRMTDEEIGENVDAILLDNDMNRDGYIDYPEFIIAQRTNNP